MFLWIKELFGRATGLFSAFGVILIPNLFGYAHFAVTDLPLASMWFLTVYGFGKVSELEVECRTRRPMGLGALHQVSRSADSGSADSLGASVSPRQVRKQYIRAALSRADRRGRDSTLSLASDWIASFGVSLRRYQPRLPGGRKLHVYFFNQYIIRISYHGTTRFSCRRNHTRTVLLASLVRHSLNYFEKRAMVRALLFIFNIIFILILGYTGCRTPRWGAANALFAAFLRSFGGSGFSQYAHLVDEFFPKPASQQITRLKLKVAGIFVLLGCFNPLLDVYLSHPFQLSYYNRLVGGIRGAYEHGLETTSFMEAITPPSSRDAQREATPKAQR